METAQESMKERLALLHAATRSIDFQYYTVNDDLTSNLFLAAAKEAAARGVRVRFLVDGVSQDDAGNALAVFDTFKNVDIRVFNPVATPELGVAAWLVRNTTDIGHATRRMHNKAMVVDNQVAIIGGRNLGDEYFDINPALDFRDLDIIAAGPVVADVSKSFDAYWNGRNTYPISMLRKTNRAPTEKEKLEKRLVSQKASFATKPFAKNILGYHVTPSWPRQLVWGEAEIAADDPEKINKPAEAGNSQPFARLLQLLSGAKTEFIMTSPYFVPQDQGVKLLQSLEARGVQTKVITNSLSSTDMIVAHSGYKPYRETLINAGVSLYEMKAKDGHEVPSRSPTETPAEAVIHTKTYLIDREYLMIGSFNFDPRSIYQNTEIALIIHNRAIGEQIARLLNEFADSESAYRLKPGAGLISDIEWVTEDKGQPQIYLSEPEADTLRMLKSSLYGLLPIEDYL